MYNVYTQVYDSDQLIGCGYSKFESELAAIKNANSIIKYINANSAINAPCNFGKDCRIFKTEHEKIIFIADMCDENYWYSIVVEKVA